MANKDNKGRSNHFTPPSVPNMNRDVRANQIMKHFNDMKENTRMEITDIFNIENNGTRTIPSVVPKK